MTDAMTHELQLRVVTPDRIIIDRKVRAVQFLGIDGSYGILPRHAPLITALAAAGVCTIENSDGSKEEMFVSGGFAEMAKNTLSLVCDAGEMAADIDPERVKEKEEEARKILDQEHALSETAIKAEASLRKALTREMLARRRSGSGTLR